MCDDLMKELDIVLNFEKEDGATNSSKLQTYFNINDDADDIFSSLITGNIQSNTFEPKPVDQKNTKSDWKSRDEVKKSVRFSDSIDDEIEIPYKESNNLNSDTCLGSAWLISESTQVILSKVLSKEINTNVNRMSLARPQLHTDPNMRLSDPIYSLLVDNYNVNTANELRQIPSIENCQDTEEEVVNFIKRGWIRPAIDLTSRILCKMGYTYAKLISVDSTSFSFTFESGRIWCIRFALLARLKLFTILELELSGFQNLDCPNLYYEFYEDSVKYTKGSIISFSMRLIYAEFPCYFNRFSEALNRLYYLLAVIKRILMNLKSGYSEDGTKLLTEEIYKKASIELWHKRQDRVYLSVLKVLIASKDYPSAIGIVHEMIKNSTQPSDISLNDLLYRLLARIYLHLGDLESSAFYFNESIKLFIEYDKLQRNEKNKIMASKLSLQNGFINMSRGHFEDAKKCFQEYLDQDSNNVMVLNNYAVCCLYLKKVPEAISVFEKLLENGIPHDAIIFNLCILFELQTTQVKHKKLKIVKLLSKTVGDDFNITSFKLTTNSD